jgi:hypothetical protein
MRKIHKKYCVMCGTAFQAKTAWARYCSIKCKSKRYNESKGYKLSKGRFCKQCGVQFFPDFRTGANQQHCSKECSRKSARESRSNFWGKQKDPKQKMKDYHKKSTAKIGPDGNLKRFRSRYPDVKLECQSCGESRVVDIAHKPEHKRNGAWRSVKNTTPEKVWILCPTCHALLDRMNYTPEELGLKGGDA